MPQKRATRSWTVQLIYNDLGVPMNRDEVQRSLLDMEAIGHRLGGVFNFAPGRERVSDEEFVTRAWLFEWRSYAPDMRSSEPPDEPEATSELPTDEEAAAEMEVMHTPPDELTQRLEEAAQAT